MSTPRASITDDSIADIRWRLEQAMEKLDDALWHTALDLIVEAGEVCAAMIVAVQADRRREAKRQRTIALQQYDGNCYTTPPAAA